MTLRDPQRKKFVVIDVEHPQDVRSPKTRMHFLRNADPTLITDHRRLLRCVWQLQGCVKMLEERAADLTV
jgi:hypothetical protein